MKRNLLRLNDTYKPGDVLIHLGDVIFSKASELTDILAGIKHKKVLVKGNHDKNGSGWYIRHGFDSVCNYVVKRRVLFSHIPVDIKSIKTYLDVDYNIHGHLHSNDHRSEEPAIKNIYDESLHILYAPEKFDYKPILLDNLIKNHEMYNLPRKGNI